MNDDSRIVVLGNCSEWLDVCLYDLTIRPNAKLINTLYPVSNAFLRKLVKIHFSQRINSKIKLPLKRIWFHSFAKNISTDTDSSLIIIIYDWNRLSNNPDFLKYLRQRFKRVKLVYIFTNIVEITWANRNHFVEKLKDYYDLVFAFDQKDSIKYGFELTQLLYSKLPLETKKTVKEAFFAGSAKDRLAFLHQSVNAFNKIGVRCNYHILGVPKEAQIESNQIQYNKPIPYRQVVNEIANSSIIIEAKQGNSSALTIKVCEAVFYNKILVTTNPNIRQLSFYDPRFMFVVSDPNEIDERMITNINKVEYNESARVYFSVERFIQEIKRLLFRRG